jgi:hypothetical protein
MEKLILEVQDRSLNQYHTLSEFPVTIGRAFDNDIIISDPSVSAHHLVINKEAEGFVVQNLSTENGSQINGKMVYNQQTLPLSIPSQLNIATRSLRVLNSEVPIERTIISACRGLFAVFCRPWGVSTLVLLTVLVVLLENYFNTEYANSMNAYISKVIPSIWFLLAFALLALGISRLVVNRWEVGPSIAIASLFVLAPHVLYEIGHWWSYFLTSDWPRDILLLVNKFVVLPILLFFFIYRIYNISKKAALGLALLLSAPLLVFQATDIIDSWTVEANSVDELSFNRTVRSWDIRLLPTLSQQDYMQQAHDALADEAKK